MSSEEARDENKQKQLWDESVKLSGLNEDESILGMYPSGQGRQ